MLAIFSVTPLDKGESVSKYVAQIVDLIDKSGIPYKLTAMGTIVEGEPDEVFSLIKQCHLAMREMSNRVITSINIDDRKAAKARLSGKIASIESKLDRQVSK